MPLYKETCMLGGMADEQDLLQLCRNLCRVEREAVLIEVESNDPDLASRIREALEKAEPQR